MAKMVTMTPNSDDAASGNEGNEDTKRWQWQQRQRRTMGIVDPAEAQDATITPTAAPRWCLLHHTVASHRIDPMEEYIKKLENKIWTAKIIWIGWPANRLRFVTKWLKRGRVHNLDLLKKELWNKNLAKKSTNTLWIDLQQAPSVSKVLAKS